MFDQHPEISGFDNRNIRENEAQYTQSVYIPDSFGFAIWGYQKDMRLFENSSLATDYNCLELYKSWRPHWNNSRAVLLEKTPRHMLMTRFLQWYLTPERTIFLVILRHPLGTLRVLYEQRPGGGGPKSSFMEDCGARAIAHWLHIHDSLFEDLIYIRNSMLVHYERFALGDTLGM